MAYAGEARFRFEGAQEDCAPYIPVARTLVERTYAMFDVRPGGQEAATQTKALPGGAWVRVTVFAQAPPIITISAGRDRSTAQKSIRLYPDCHTGLQVQSDAREEEVLGWAHDFLLRVDEKAQLTADNILEEQMAGGLPDYTVLAGDEWRAPRTLDNPYGTEFWNPDNESAGDWPTEVRVARYCILNRLASFVHVGLDGYVYGGLQDNCGRGKTYECYWPYFITDGEHIVRKVYIHTNTREVAQMPHGATNLDTLKMWVSADKVRPGRAPDVEIPFSSLSLFYRASYGMQHVICDITKKGDRLLFQQINGSWGMSYGGRPNLEYGALYELALEVTQAENGDLSLSASSQYVLDPDTDTGWSQGTTIATIPYQQQTAVMEVTDFVEEAFCDSEGENCQDLVTEITLSPGVFSPSELYPVHLMFGPVNSYGESEAGYDGGRYVILTAFYDDDDLAQPVTLFSRAHSSTQFFDSGSLSIDGTATLTINRSSNGAITGYEWGLSSATISHPSSYWIDNQRAVLDIAFGARMLTWQMDAVVRRDSSEVANGAMHYQESTGRVGTIYDVSPWWDRESVVTSVTELVDTSPLDTYHLTDPYPRGSDFIGRVYASAQTAEGIVASEWVAHAKGTATSTRTFQIPGHTTSPSRVVDGHWIGNWDSCLMVYLSYTWNEAYVEFAGSTKYLRMRNYAGTWWDEKGQPPAQQVCLRGKVHTYDGLTLGEQDIRDAGRAMYAETFPVAYLIENMHYAFDGSAYNPVTGQLAYNFPYGVSWTGMWPENWDGEVPYKPGLHNGVYSLTQQAINYEEWTYAPTES